MANTIIAQTSKDYAHYEDTSKNPSAYITGTPDPSYLMYLQFSTSYMSKYRQIVNFDTKFNEYKIKYNNSLSEITVKNNKTATTADLTNIANSMYGVENLKNNNYSANSYSAICFDENGYLIRNVVDEIIKELDTYALAQEIAPTKVDVTTFNGTTYTMGSEAKRNNWYYDEVSNITTEGEIVGGNESTISKIWSNTDLVDLSSGTKTLLTKNNAIQIRNNLLWYFDDQTKAMKCYQHILKLYPNILNPDFTTIENWVLCTNAKTAKRKMISIFTGCDDNDVLTKVNTNIDTLLDGDVLYPQTTA